jgi:hypothetical protein
VGAIEQIAESLRSDLATVAAVARDTAATRAMVEALGENAAGSG